MRDLQESLRLTYLFISHDLRMVELVARLVMVMYIGQVVEMAPARTLAAGAAHPYSRLLWSAVDPYTGRRIERTAAPLRWEIAACRDKETEPRLTEVSSGHLVACHLPQGR